MLADLVGDEDGARAASGQPGEQRRPCRRARRTGRASARRRGPSTRAAASASGDQLAALVLHAGAAVAHGREGAGVAAGRAPRRTATSGRARAPAPSSSSTVGQARAGDAGSPGGARCRPRAAASSARPSRRGGAVPSSAARSAATTQRGWLVRDREARRPGRSPAPGATSAEPRRRGRVRATRAQHGVDEARPRRCRRPARARPTRLGDRGVRRHPHAEQLVGAEPQHVEHRRVELASGAVEAARRCTASYVPAHPQRAVGQLGGEGGVAAVGCRAAAQQRRAARGWRRRPLGDRAQTRRRPPAGPGRARRARRRGPLRPGGPVGRTRRPRAVRRRRRRSRAATPDAARPVGRRHRPLAVGLHRRRAAPAPEPVPTSDDVALADQQRPGPARSRRPPSAATGSTGPSLSRSPRNVVHAPGAGVQPRTRRSTASGRARPATRASSTLSFGASADAVGGLRRASSVPSSMPSRVATSSPAPRDGEPAEQVAAGVRGAAPPRSRRRTPGRCPGPPRAEGRGAGHLVAGHHRVLHRGRPAPGGQQREVQVDPAVARHVERRRAGRARRRRRPGSSPGASVAQRGQERGVARARPGFSTGTPGSSARCADRRAAEPAAAAGRGVGPGEDGDDLVPGGEQRLRARARRRPGCRRRPRARSSHAPGRRSACGLSPHRRAVGLRRPTRPRGWPASPPCAARGPAGR